MTNYTLKKTSTRLCLPFLILLIAGMLVGNISFATTYFVDATAGNDNNNGTSEATAWRTLGKVNGFAFVAGDIIRFKRGQSWSGALNISRSGTSSNVITFTNYSTGNKPLINGGGASEAIFVNSNHVVVDGFAMTNFAGASVTDGAEAKRHGVRVGSGNSLTNVKILNNEIYFVEGFSNHTTVASPRGTSLDPASNNQYMNGAIFAQPSSISGLTVQGNYIHDCSATGILLAIGGSKGTNVVVRSNALYNVGSDGIELWNCNSPLIELNSVIKAGNNSGNGSLSGGFLGANGLAVCGIWTFQSDAPVQQYNYCEGTRQIRYDGQAWDFDIGVTGAGVYQYNYSRDNEGGFNLGGLSANDAGFVYRYNISYNDGSKQGGSSGQGFFNGASQFYNNVFYRTDGKVFHFDAFTKTTGTFKNNIFYSPTSPAQTYVADGRVFSNNCFFGHTANSPGTSPVLANPNFVNAAGATKVPPGVILNSPNDLRSYVNGLKLNTGSPCINTGTTVPNGGLDFWGAALYSGSPDIGANEVSGAPPPPGYSAKRTLSSITVDGNLNESVWGPEINSTINETVSGAPNNNVTFGAMWDNNYLYVGVKVLDGNLFNESANIWDDDAIEIYIDQENNGGAYGANDRQFTKGYNDAVVGEIQGRTTGVLHGWTAIAGGYQVELAIPWSNIGVTPTATMTIGFDIGINDDDNGTARDHQQVWRGDGNNWQSTTNFGDLQLSSTTTGAGVPVTSISVAPASATISTGNTTTLTATVSPSNASNPAVTWQSGNTAVATVNASGVVTGVAAGTANITARSTDGTNITSNASVITVTPPSTSYVAKNVTAAITVDGNLNESVWGPEINFAANKTVSGTPNNNVTFGALWNSTYLYVAIKVLDGNLFNESANVWDDDAIEIYIDQENNGGAYGANDRQFTKGYNDAVVGEIQGRTTGVLHGWTAIAGGYQVELAIPWSNFGVTPSANMTIGFDIGINDDDNGTARDHQQVWRGDGNNWQSTANFGDLVLSATTTGGGGSVARPATEKASEAVQKTPVLIYPNPVHANAFRLQLDAAQKMPVNISILNEASQITYRYTKYLQAGSNSIDIPVAKLTNGTYTVIIDKGNERTIKKLVIAR